MKGGVKMQWWHIGAAANLVILAAYLAISLLITRGLLKSKQTPHENPLGWATAAIFFTCAIHHGSHPVHQILPALDVEVDVGNAMRAAFDEWHVSGWDVLTAAVAVWYLTLRARFPALVRGAAIFEDIKLRQRQALDIHDNIVQGLADAKISFELDRNEQAMRAVEETLVASRRIITDLLGEEGSEIAFEPGDFRRKEPGKVAR